MNESDKTIVVIGATGQQGKGVVSALKTNTQFKVRAVSRNPKSYQGPADEVVSADLNDKNGLVDAFKGAYGVFVVTNFWEQGTNEISQAKNAISAASEAGIKHFVWSTLPNVKRISSGKYHVPHFTDKAAVDILVKQAGFEYHTYVVASFFYQNLLTNMAPQLQPSGEKGWVLPLSKSNQCIHMADISELGETVAGAFNYPEKAGQGQYLPVVGDLLSFADIIGILKAQGHDYTYTEVDFETFSTFFPGADELGQMFGYFGEHTYMGGQFEKADFEREQDVAGRRATSFANWASTNW